MNYFFFLKDGNNIFDMRSIFDLGWDCPHPLVISSRYKKNWQTPLSRPRVCPESVLFNKGLFFLATLVTQSLRVESPWHEKMQSFAGYSARKKNSGTLPMEF